MQPWERRLKDLGHLLSNCGATYFDPERFRLNTNQFLQTSRTVTFIIQKNKSQVPNFQAWYKAHAVTPRSQDRVMTWARDARNVIEKEGDLELHSSLVASLVFSYLKSEDLVISTGTEELLSANVEKLMKFAARKLPSYGVEHAFLRIERRRVANSLPSHELVHAMTYVYGRV